MLLYFLHNGLAAPLSVFPSVGRENKPKLMTLCALPLPCRYTEVTLSTRG